MGGAVAVAHSLNPEAAVSLNVSILRSLGLGDVLNEDSHPVGQTLHLFVFRGADSDAQVQVGLAVLIGHHSLVGYHRPALAVSLNATAVKVGSLLFLGVILVGVHGKLFVHGAA